MMSWHDVVCIQQLMKLHNNDNVCCTTMPAVPPRLLRKSEKVRLAHGPAATIAAYAVAN